MSRAFLRLKDVEQDAVTHWALPSHQNVPREEPLVSVEETLTLPSPEEIEAIKQAAYQAGFEQGQAEGQKAGHQVGYDAGFQQGESEGKQAGLEQQNAEAQAVLAEWQGWIAKWESPLMAQEQALIERLTKLVKDWVETFIGVEMRLQPELLAAQIEESLSLLPESNAPLSVVLSPLDVQELRALGVTLPLKEDPTLERGDFQIKREASAIVWRLRDHLLPYLDRLECVSAKDPSM